jgi:hypothetical protein
MPLDAAECEGIFAEDAAAFDHAPAGRLKGGVNVLGSGFGFVHGLRLGAPFS